MAKKSRYRVRLPATKAPTGNNSKGGAVSAPQVLNLSNLVTSPRKGTPELLKLYAEAPWLRAIVSKIAKAVAEVDWCLFARKAGQGRYIHDNMVHRKRSVDARQRYIKTLEATGEYEEINNHPILDLFYNGTGNPRLNGFGVFQVTQSHMELAGEAYWLLEKDQFGVPRYTWPMPPSWVKKIPTEKDPFYEINAAGGSVIKIPMTEIIPFVDVDPSNPYGRGVSMAQALDDEIQIDEFAAKHQKSFFLNRARPDIIISGQFIQQKDAERLEKQWLADHQGFWKAFKPLFFSQKIDVKELSQTFESMQMVQVRAFERDTFISVFGIPPEKLGVVGDSKRSTIAAADNFWQKDIIRPRLEAMRRPIQALLVPYYDDRLVLDYETPVIQDEEFKLKIMKDGRHAFTVNDWRKLAGEPPVPNGDMMMWPLNEKPVPTSGEIPEDETDDTDSNASDDDKKINTDLIVRSVTENLVDALEENFGDLAKMLKRAKV